MSNLSEGFAACMPSTEDEMLDICRTLTQEDKSVSNFLLHIERIEQLADVMRDYLKTNRKERGGSPWP